MADYKKYINSTGTHYISNSGKDEDGTYRNGTAGDQTGHEWELRSWYNRPWDCVLRYEKKPGVGMKIAELACAAAFNNNIGYDQNQRGTYWAQLKANGYDPSKITTRCESDCSAGVIANVKAVGYLFGISALQNIDASFTGNMKNGFRAAGFTVLTDSKYLNGPDYLLPGDILLNEAHHTATNITAGKKTGGVPDITITPKSTLQAAPAKPKKTIKATAYANCKMNSLSGKYVVTAYNLNMRNGAGMNHRILVELPRGTEVFNYGYYSLVGGVKWLYVQAFYQGCEYIGFCSSQYLRKK